MKIFSSESLPKKSANKKKRRKLRNRTKFTIIAIVNIIWFTIAVLILCLKDKQVPDSLIIAWFSAWTVELALLFGIKVQNKDDN